MLLTSLSVSLALSLCPPLSAKLVSEVEEGLSAVILYTTDTGVKHRYCNATVSVVSTNVLCKVLIYFSSN